MSEAEKLVRELDKCRALVRTYDHAICRLRLGLKLDMAGEQRVKRFSWRKMVYAFGWSSCEGEPFPVEIEGEFYEFMVGKLERERRKVEELEARVAAL